MEYVERLASFEMVWRIVTGGIVKLWESSDMFSRGE